MPRFDTARSPGNLGTMRRRAARRALATTTVSLGVLAAQGCAAIPLAVIAGSLLEAGGSAIVKTGTEYTASGTALRTFAVPVEQVHAAVLEAFSRVQILVVREQTSPKRHRIEGRMQGRKVRVDLFPLTPTLTAMTLDVKRNAFASDKATASELLAQVERAVNDGLAAASAPAAAEPPPCKAAGRARRGG
jgi:hypothetical protein